MNGASGQALSAGGLEPAYHLDFIGFLHRGAILR
jgi:hypothetical protein